MFMKHLTFEYIFAINIIWLRQSVVFYLQCIQMVVFLARSPARHGKFIFVYRMRLLRSISSYFLLTYTSINYNITIFTHLTQNRVALKRAQNCNNHRTYVKKKVCSEEAFYPSPKNLNKQRSERSWHFLCLGVLNSIKTFFILLKFISPSLKRICPIHQIYSTQNRPTCF